MRGVFAFSLPFLWSGGPYSGAILLPAVQSSGGAFWGQSTHGSHGSSNQAVEANSRRCVHQEGCRTHKAVYSGYRRNCSQGWHSYAAGACPGAAYWHDTFEQNPRGNCRCRSHSSQKAQHQGGVRRCAAGGRGRAKAQRQHRQCELGHLGQLSFLYISEETPVESSPWCQNSAGKGEGGGEALAPQIWGAACLYGRAFDFTQNLNVCLNSNVGLGVTHIRLGLA